MESINKAAGKFVEVLKTYQEQTERCPFCGNEHPDMCCELYAYDNYSMDCHYRVYCYMCGSSSAWYDTPDEAIYMWNGRDRSVNLVRINSESKS